MKSRVISLGMLLFTLGVSRLLAADVPQNTIVEGQPLAANVLRLKEALDFLALRCLGRLARH